MEYQDYSPIDFLKDEFFVKWIVTNDKAAHEFWHRWVINHPEKQDDIKRAREILQSLQLKDKYELKQDQYEKMLDQIIFHQRKGLQIRKPSNSASTLRKLAVAASISIIILLSGLFIFNDINQSIDNTEIVELKTKKVPAGIKYTMKLQDGTMVKLNSSSSITYPEHFSDSVRIVYLEGEAFFEVVKDSLKPFIIKTGIAETQVLGTSFNVKAYHQKSIQVAVISGSVKIKNAYGNEKLLAPYQMGVMNENSEEIVTDQFDVKHVIGWKDGILIFDKAKFQEVIRKLSMWYGVEFQINPDLQVNGVYSGEYRNESLEDVLNGIAYSSGFNFRIENKSVYVY